MAVVRAIRRYNKESGPPQTLATPGKTATGGVGGRASDKNEQVDKGCCGGCVVL
jgi:GTPase KRas protein